MIDTIKTKSAFTLAEVLITLVIIGIVAALTVSAVINTYVERSTISKVKKGLSTIAQAKKLAEAQNGSIIGWNFGSGATAETAAQFWSYLKPHLSVARDCGANTDCYINDGVYYLNRSNHTYNFNDSFFYRFVLNDSGVMLFRMGETGKCSYSHGGFNNVCAVFYYDVNGNKKPNTLGRDIFLYEFTADGVFPYKYDSRCNKSSFGSSCSGYIIQHNNMNYLH